MMFSRHWQLPPNESQVKLLEPSGLQLQSKAPLLKLVVSVKAPSLQNWSFDLYRKAFLISFSSCADYLKIKHYFLLFKHYYLCLLDLKLTVWPNNYILVRFKIKLWKLCITWFEILHLHMNLKTPQIYQLVAHPIHHICIGLVEQLVGNPFFRVNKSSNN